MIWHASNAVIRARRKSGSLLANKAVDLSFFSFFAAHLAQVRNMLWSRCFGSVSHLDCSGELEAAVALPGLGLLELRGVCGSSAWVSLSANNKSWPDLEFFRDWLDFLSDAWSDFSTALDDREFDLEWVIDECREASERDWEASSDVILGSRVSLNFGVIGWVQWTCQRVVARQLFPIFWW